MRIEQETIRYKREKRILDDMIDLPSSSLKRQRSPSPVRRRSRSPPPVVRRRSRSPPMVRRRSRSPPQYSSRNMDSYRPGIFFPFYVDFFSHFLISSCEYRVLSNLWYIPTSPC